MCQAFADLGHTVTLIAAGIPGNTLDDYSYYGVDPSFSIHRLRWPRKRYGGLVHGFLVGSYLIRNRDAYDFVYGRSFYGIYEACLLQIPCGFEVHAPPTNSTRRWIEGQIMRSPSLQVVVFITKALANLYRNMFPWLPPQHVLIAHDAADIVPSDTPAVDLPGRKDVLQVGYVGHLYRGKGAEVVTTLASQMPDIDFHLVGGTEENIAYWRNKVCLPNLFIHGYVPHGEIQRYHKAMDVLLLPAGRTVHSAGNRGNIADWMSPLKMFEYMAAGKPIVASNLPVLQEVLIDGVNALLVPPDDIDSWIAALIRIKSDQGLAERLAKSAHCQFLANNTWQQRAKMILDNRVGNRVNN